MKLSFVPWAAIVCSVHAQYFSEGWKPGQPVTQEYSAPASTQPAQQNPKGFSASAGLDRILSSGPVSSFFAKAGLNISSIASVAGLTSAGAYPWDSRIPMITDASYNDTIVNEVMTEEEEKNRTWIIVVSASTTAQGGGMSQYVDQVFDETFNETLIANDMPHLRWARIDYLNVTYITTKWGVWQAPTFVILQDRGQTLRFIKPQWLRLREGALRELLTSEAYTQIPPWDSSFGPGGSNEWILHYLGIALTTIYNVLVKVPRWLLYVLSGSVASFLIQLMHRGSAAPKSKPDAQPTPANEGKESELKEELVQDNKKESAAPSTPSKSGKAKQRKSKR
ncbi:hypothetical protein D9757_001123 [Collybiopsis confluens]|uniref:Thioredoxin domain-containing protein n=1 Tax=Collybiopsis confluens TaxID=2823264 RepID=A0A8H5MGF5_9AGAR|nr:hypothetical protein D9757_001123 [Collybiopsis confluens]